MIQPILAVIAALAVAACGRSGDPELDGDRAYGDTRYAAALSKYREALTVQPGGRLWAKAAAAALHVGELREATDGYLRLAADDPSRVDEAADGLERTAWASEREGNGAALYDAVLGLQSLRPGRPAGRYAAAVLRWRDLSRTDALALLPAAMAAAPDAHALDSLLIVYGEALRSANACEPAAQAYAAALRRSRGVEIRATAGEGLAGCGLRLGLAALKAGKLAAAERWLVQAIDVDSSSVVGRRALVGFGRARAAAGDTLGAAIVFQSVVSLSRDADSISQAAAAQLSALQ